MNCDRCDHSIEKHCKSGVKHVNHKQEMWPVAKDWHICKVRHCLLPLCSCVDFVEPAPELPAMFTQPIRMGE